MKISLHPSLRRVARSVRHVSRYTVYLLLFLALLLGASYGVARYYLPELLARQGDIGALITNMAQRPVRIEKVEAYWDNVYPGAALTGVTILADDGRTSAIRIAEVRMSFALMPLLWGKLELHNLVLVRPALTVRRNANGAIGVDGVQAPPPSAADANISHWLLTHRRLEVEDGDIQWIDERDTAAPLRLSPLRVYLRNQGTHHRATADLGLPPQQCRACNLRLAINGDPFTNEWSGDVAIEARGIDIETLPKIVRERLPAELRGRFDVAVNSDWRDGQLWRARGDAGVTGLRLPLPEFSRPLTLRQASAGISWRARDDGWRVDLTDLTLALAGRPWGAGNVRATYSPTEKSLRAGHINVSDITAFVTTLPIDSAWRQRWLQLKPEGALDDAQIRITGAIEQPSALDVRARLSRLSLLPYKNFPGFGGLSGWAALDLNGGQFTLDANNFSLRLPHVFRQPLSARHASGFLRWKRQDDGWQIAATEMRVNSPDGAGTGTLRLDLPSDAAQSPVLRLRVDFRNGNGRRAATYYPAYHLNPRVLQWMESSFVDGRIDSGYLVYEGPIREFPFRENQGRFELRGRVSDAVYRYLPGWAAVTQADVDVAVNGENVTVTGSGKIGTLDARELRVVVQRPRSAPEINIHTRIEGPVAETVRIVKEAKAKDARWMPYLDPIASADGEGTLDLNLVVRTQPGQTDSWNGTYRFTGAAFRLDNGMGLLSAKGAVSFDDTGLNTSEVHGQLFGGPATFAATRADNHLNIQSSGQLVAAQLLRSRPSLATRMDGAIDWSFNYQGSEHGPRLRFDTDLSALRSRLPVPLDNPNGGLPNIAIATETTSADAMLLGLQAGNDVSGKLAFAKTPAGWRFVNGRVELGNGQTTLPRDPGLFLNIAAQTLNLDEWLPLLGGSVGAQPLPSLVSWISADVSRVVFADRNWGRLILHLIRNGGNWKTVIDGQTAAGDGEIILTGAPATPRFRFALAHLRLPEKIEGPVAIARPDTVIALDPRQLPAIELQAQSLEYKGRTFGQLKLNTEPSSEGWRIDQLSLTRPETRMKLSGHWRRLADHDHTQLNAELQSDNMGTFLEAVGSAGQMADGNMRVTANLSWDGTPMKPVMASVGGKVELSTRKGRFLKFDPGLMRLAGLLDLRSVVRFLTLDFSSAFGKGFAYDEIDGTINIDRGNADTRNFTIEAPGLRIGARGRIGLAAKDYDLTIDANPRVGAAVALTSWSLLGPQAAAVVYAMQRLFKRQIQSGTRITYVIKGPWEQPTITRVGADDKPITPPGETPQ